jgi:hypothetical protein
MRKTVDEDAVVANDFMLHCSIFLGRCRQAGSACLRQRGLRCNAT